MSLRFSKAEVASAVNEKFQNHDKDIQGVFFNWAYPLDWPPPKMLRLAPP